MVFKLGRYWFWISFQMSQIRSVCIRSPKRWRNGQQMLDAIPQNCTCPPRNRQHSIYFVPITMGLFCCYKVAYQFSDLQFHEIFSKHLVFKRLELSDLSWCIYFQKISASSNEKFWNKILPSIKFRYNFISKFWARQYPMNK